MGGTAAPRKLMLLLLGVRTRGRWFDSDLVHQAVSANGCSEVLEAAEHALDGNRSGCEHVPFQPPSLLLL
jgi:hypothetical protein